MSDYENAWDLLVQAMGGAVDKRSARRLTVDQQLEAAKVAAILSVAQELSALNPQNTTTLDRDGVRRNGWGMPTPS